MPDEDLDSLIEAALYAAGKPLTVDELCRAAGTTSRRKAVEAVRRMSAKINSTFKAIELAQVGDGRYVLQLRTKFNPIAKKFATQQLLTKSVLKTLTMIAYFQPVSANKMASKRGTQVYAHLRVLESMGFVSSTIEGKNHVYRTTAFFSQYFGLPVEPAPLKHRLESLFPPATSGKA